mmetsp:Transcript_12357/g.41120  ORF Transcript_12357/g.41120 Transcript_12357/m.41120 type:complete len:226 (+) Transcript_12357:283-960(+)
MVLNKCLTPFRPGIESLAPPYFSSPFDANAMCVIHCSMPSKMCVAYTTVAPRCSHSSRRNCNKSSRPRMSKSTVISSHNKTLNGFKSPIQICTRRRCPSETVIIDHSTSMSNSSIKRARRSGSMFSMPKIIFPALKSPDSATEPALPMFRRHWLPRYPSSPEQVKLMSWNGGRPITLTQSSLTIVFPARICSNVVFPAPFAPESRHRDPAGRSRLKSLRICSPPG